MISIVLSIHDSKADAFLPPFFATNEAVALRMFEAATHDSSTDFCRYAADYTLFQIGTFNDQTGLVSHLDPIKSIINGQVLKANQNTNKEVKSS